MSSGRRREGTLRAPLISTTILVIVSITVAAGVLAASWGAASRSKAHSDAPTMAKARAAYESGDYKLAASLLAELVDSDTGDLAARKALAEALTAQGKNDEALEQYEAIVNVNPEDHQTLAAMASIEQLLGRAQASIDHLEAAVGIEREAEYLAALAPLYATVGRWDDCVKTWEQYLDEAELDEAAQAEAYAAIAAAHENARQYDKAKEALRQALFLDPNNESYKARLEAYGS